MKRYAKRKIPARPDGIETDAAMPIRKNAPNRASTQAACPGSSVRPILNELTRSRKIMSSGTKVGPELALPAAPAAAFGIKRIAEANGSTGRKINFHALGQTRAATKSE